MKARGPLAICAMAVGACAVPSEPPGPVGRVQGSLVLPQAARGNGYAFLYPSGQGPPLRQGRPLYATAVSDGRLLAGDRSFVFSSVAPGAYRLWGFLDAQRRFSPDVDVLGQPRAGDRQAVGVELALPPSQVVSVDLPEPTWVAHEPPAFVVEGADPKRSIDLPDQLGSIIVFTLTASDLGVLDPSRVGFSVALPDPSDPNAAPNSVGVPFLYPQVFLRFAPKPGQTVPTDANGQPADVIVPLVFNPFGYLVQLGGDATREVRASALTVVMIPQAQAVTYPPGAPREVAALGAIPVGDYELWVIQKSGQFWRIPNDLAAPPSQGVQFRFIHGYLPDSGAR